MTRVSVRPEMLRWACERADRELSDLACRIPGLLAWEKGEKKPTLKQLESFANATHVPFGYLFLSEPPEEDIPIPDFRTVGERIHRPSPDLLDTIYAMQRRVAWLREERLECEADPIGFVGSAKLSDDPSGVGREMRRTLGLGHGWAAAVGTWQDAVRELQTAIEITGVMAVINGVVGNNTHRPLKVSEFRGFSLCDSYAPLIFVNGADAKSAQMFTLAHELAHLWLGSDGEGLSGFEALSPSGDDVEIFCDKAAAEFLLPAQELIDWWRIAKREEEPFKNIARHFKVSPIVAGRRALDLRLIDRETFFDFYYEYTASEHRLTGSAGGGDFYNNQNTRVGQAFAAEVIRAAKSGRLTFRDAYSLTGLRGGAFHEYANRLGFELP